MPTPVIVSNLVGFEGAASNNGPWEDSATTDLYTTVFDDGTFQIHMFRSTDAGLTWTAQDDGAAPVAVGFANNSPVVYDDTLKTLTVLLDPDPTFAGLMRIFQFDTTTNTWNAGASSPAYVDAGITFNGFDKMALRAGGDYVIFFTGFDGLGINNCYFTTWSPGGGWLPAQIFLAPQIDDLPLAIVAAGARVHVFSTGPAATLGTNLFHRTIHGDNSFTVTDTIATDCIGASGTAADFAMNDLSVAFNVGLNELAFSFLTITGALHSMTAAEADTPVWTETDLGQTYDPGAGGFIFTNTSTISVGASIFTYRIMGPSPFTIVQVELGGATTIVLPAQVPQPQRFNVALVGGVAAGVWNQDPAGGTAPSQVAYVLFGGSPPPPTPVNSSLNAIGVINGGTAQDPIPVIPEIRVRRASQIIVDLQPSQNATDLWIEIALHGVKLVRKGSRYSLDKSKAWRGEEFTYPTILPAGAPGATFLKQTVPLDSDSAFQLFGVYSTTNAITGYSFLFYGPNGETLEFGLAFAGTAPPQPSLISGGNCVGTSRRPRTFCPPVTFPPGGAIQFDYHIPNPAPAGDADRPMYLCFTGRKLYGRWL